MEIGDEDICWLGCAPAEEHCAQVGDPDYARDAKAECRAYIEAIRTVCGREPDGARLVVRPQDHDFGTYYEVAVVFDGDDPDAAAYAAKCDGHAPATWEAVGMAAPARSGWQR